MADSASKRPQPLGANAPVLAEQCARALGSRGVTLKAFARTGQEDKNISEFRSSTEAGHPDICSMILDSVPAPEVSVELGNTIAQHAERSGPPVLLIPLPLLVQSAHPSLGSSDEHAASIALLRARGAIVLRDPDVWIECIVLLAAHGLPPGPHGAIVAHPGAWLALAAAALQTRAEAVGERFSPLAAGLDADATTDFVLVDAELDLGESFGRVLPIPVGVAGTAANRPCLVGLANALSAAEAAGQASRRITAGDGPATSENAPDEDIDQGRFERQLDKLSTAAGDHECKVLLSSYGVPITRQAVATTPSAATRIAKKAGYPVEVKGWGADMPSEPEGAVVLSDVHTAADVRRAFSTICSRANCEAVIIRETPAPGREVRIHIRPVGSLGPVCFLYQQGQRAPAAALAPLRPIDAQAMARHVVASRAGDKDPDWDALSDLLIHASHMVSENPRLVSVELNRVIVRTQGDGAVVIDARATLQPEP